MLIELTEGTGWVTWRPRFRQGHSSPDPHQGCGRTLCDKPKSANQPTQLPETRGRMAALTGAEQRESRAYRGSEKVVARQNGGNVTRITVAQVAEKSTMGRPAVSISRIVPWQRSRAHLSPAWYNRKAANIHNTDASMGEIQCILLALVHPNQNRDIWQPETHGSDRIHACGNPRRITHR